MGFFLNVLKYFKIEILNKGNISVKFGVNKTS